MRKAHLVYIGCAGWGLPRPVQDQFPGNGTLLTRYATKMSATEINSSFYRSHRPSTYARWAASVPAGFRFSVKIPKAITHERRLGSADDLLAAFLSEATSLGEQLGCLLVQLPPSLELSSATAEAFFTSLRARFAGAVAAEPRHPSWFTPEADRLLNTFRIARVAADPARVPAAAEPSGWPGTVYYRLHGSPRVYFSAYSEDFLDALALRLHEHAAHGAPVWCIFDNTTLGAAAANALYLLGKVVREETMIADLIHEHAVQVTAPKDGKTYRVRTFGRARSDGMWEGWLEFHPVDRPGAVLRTERETTQADREALVYWATGLEPIYLDGALARAR